MGVDINSLPPWAQKQIADKVARQMREKAENLASNGGKGKSKYKNIPAERSGAENKIKFDSQSEARRYDELMLMLKAGTITDLRLQREFTLIEAYTTPDGKRVRAERYKADFTYWRNGEFFVEDVKGGNATKTKTYEIKKKQMLDKYGIEVKEIE